MDTSIAKAEPSLQTIVDIDALVIRSVQNFAATNDIRYYLNGVHVLAAEHPVVMASDGHIAYCEEALFCKASVSVTLKISKAARVFLKQDTRVQVQAYLKEDGTPIATGSVLTVVNADDQTVYIEPGPAVVECRYPDIPALMGDFSEWQEGLIGGFNTELLTRAISLPGYVRFYHRGAGPDSSAYFTFEAKKSHAKGVGIVMPARTAPFADAIPKALRKAA